MDAEVSDDHGRGSSGEGVSNPGADVIQNDQGKTWKEVEREHHVCKRGHEGC